MRHAVDAEADFRSRQEEWKDKGAPEVKQRVLFQKLCQVGLKGAPEVKQRVLFQKLCQVGLKGAPEVKQRVLFQKLCQVGPGFRIMLFQNLGQVRLTVPEVKAKKQRVLFQSLGQTSVLILVDIITKDPWSRRGVSTLTDHVQEYRLNVACTTKSHVRQNCSLVSVSWSACGELADLKVWQTAESAEPQKGSHTFHQKK
jgi:hypothetical protein